MVNPPPGSNERRGQGRILDFDELLAVVLAFLGIGTILWWGLTRDRSFLAQGSALAPILEGQSRNRDVESEARSGGLFQPHSFEEPSLAPGQPLPAQPTSPPAKRPGVTQSPGRVSPTPTAVPAPVMPNPAETEATLQTTLPLDISDVSPNHWAYPFIKAMYDGGYLPDFPSGQFLPDQVLTRAELAALLNRAMGDFPNTRQPFKFSDVPQNYWAAPAIDRVVAEGFMSGYPDQSFAPDRSVPRYEVLVAIATGLKLPPSTNPDTTLKAFVDAPALPPWSQPKVAATAEQGLIVNYPRRDQLQPNQAATRAEIVALLHQALVREGKLPPVNSAYVVPPI